MSAIPERVDVVILGTGLVNSILAAACSRIGKSVLHLDENFYYGDDWASFTFQQLVERIKSMNPNYENTQPIPEELIQKSRMFCLDLAPRFLYSNGEMVDLLVKSNVARYHEFKNNIRILCCIGEDIHVMPCRRNEVFTSPLLPNLADKRRLMKFIELCLNYNSENSTLQDGELIDSSDKPIGQFLQERGLNLTLQEFIINSIAMVSPQDPTRKACKQIKRFMVATERYGRSPFLFPLYGCGEFPQSFCRLSAVFGGLYCLNTQIKSVKLAEKSKATGEESSSDNFSVVFSDDEYKVNCNMLVVEHSSAANLVLIVKDFATPVQDHPHLSRAMIITRKSIVPSPTPDDTEAASSSQDLISFMRIPPSETNPNLVFVIELNSSALVCPKEFCIIYLWTKSTNENPEEDLKATVKRIFKGDTSCVAWSFYYRQLIRASSDQLNPPVVQSKPPGGLYLTSPCCDDIDYASAIQEAKRLFARMCPGEEFLPRAPDPDEIINV